MVIPARLGSTRLPEKVLLNDTGQYLIQHTWERVKAAKCAERVLIATDAEEVAEAARSFGAEVVITSSEHTCGTERVAEILRGTPEHEVVVNVQGDEPEMEPELLDAVAREVEGGEDFVTAAAVITEPALLTDPSVVNVVVDREDYALYFSRSEIPYERHYVEDAAPFLAHIGIYGFRREALLRLVDSEPGLYERVEGLEQLRILEHGWRIKVVRAPRYHGSVDTMADYRAFVERWRGGTP